MHAAGLEQLSCFRVEAGDDHFSLSAPGTSEVLFLNLSQVGHGAPPYLTTKSSLRDGFFAVQITSETQFLSWALRFCQLS